MAVGGVGTPSGQVPIPDMASVGLIWAALVGVAVGSGVAVGIGVEVGVSDGVGLGPGVGDSVGVGEKRAVGVLEGFAGCGVNVGGRGTLSVLLRSEATTALPRVGKACGSSRRSEAVTSLSPTRTATKRSAAARTSCQRFDNVRNFKILALGIG
jgi:hypothetical protein